jgi:hypothetical protein
MDACVKQELVAPWSAVERGRRNDDVAKEPLSVIELSDSDSDSDDNNDTVSRKRARVSKGRVLKESGAVVPTGFLQALPAAADMALTRRQSDATLASSWQSSCKQFWKAGDYEGSSRSDWDSSSGSPLLLSVPLVHFLFRLLRN